METKTKTTIKEIERRMNEVAINLSTLESLLEEAGRLDLFADSNDISIGYDTEYQQHYITSDEWGFRLNLFDNILDALSISFILNGKRYETFGGDGFSINKSEDIHEWINETTAYVKEHGGIEEDDNENKNNNLKKGEKNDS